MDSKRIELKALLIGDRWLDDPTDGIYRPSTYVYRLTPADS
jgi:hypothetical protein